MLQFVISNHQKYDWNAHLYLSMNRMNLGSWLERMSFFDNCAEALAIYALSDMLGIHTTILTMSKPWITVCGDYGGTVEDLLDVSSVNLVYLGQHKYARIWKKVVPDGSSYIGPNFNYSPMLALPEDEVTTLTTEELNMAQVLLDLCGEEDFPSIAQTSTEIPTPDINALQDAMDKIVDHVDTCTTGALSVTNAMA